MTERWIYHFTDASNVARIVAAGGVHPDAVMASNPRGFIECASADIKAARRTKPVPVHPFGCVGDYVPFYYAPRSPMMSAISFGQVPGYRDSRQLVYLVSSLMAVDVAGLTWTATDGNARAGTTRFVNTWRELEVQTDWGVMKEQYWINTPSDGDRRRRRMAEFLVRDFFPVELVVGLVAHNSLVLDTIRAVLPPNMKTAVRPGYYI